VEPPVRIELTT